MPGYVFLTAADIYRIASFLDMEVEAFTKRYTRLAPNRRGLCLIDKEDDACIFLGDQNECEIQSVKPAQCKAFPATWRYEMMDSICEGWIAGASAQTKPGEDQIQ